MQDLNGESSSENNAPVVIKNRTFIVAEHGTSCSASDQERSQNKKESFLKHEVTTAEKLQVKINSSQSSTTNLFSVETQEHKCAGAKNHVCDATYVIDSDEGYVSSRALGLSNGVNKMVSPALLCSSTSSQQDTLLSGEHHLATKNINSKSDTGKDLVQAVLCSRNKIVRALAGITQKKLLRSSKLCSQETKCPINVLFSSSESGEEYCGETDNKIYEGKGKKEIDKAYMTKEKSSTGNEIENEARDFEGKHFEKCQSLCFSLTKSSSFVGRQSIKLISVNSPPKALPNFDKFHESSKKQLTRYSRLCSTPRRLTTGGEIFESSKYDEVPGRGFSGKGSKGNESDRSAVDRQDSGFKTISVKRSCIQIDKIFESKVGGERCGFENEAPDLEKYHSVGTRSDKSHPFGRRKSMIICSDSSPPRTIQRCNFGKCGEKSPSSPSRKKSITLCQLTSSEASSLSGKIVEGCTPKSRSISSDADVVTALSNERTTPSYRCASSSEHPSRLQRISPTRRSSPTRSGADVEGCVAAPQRTSLNTQAQSPSSGNRLAFPEPSSQSFRVLRPRRSSQIHCEKNLEESLLTSQSNSPLAAVVATLPRNRTMSCSHRNVSPSLIPQSPVIGDRRKSSRIRRLSDDVFSAKLGGRRAGNVDHQNHRSEKCHVLKTPCYEESDEVFEDVNEQLKDSVQDVTHSPKGGMLTTSCGKQLAKTPQMILLSPHKLNSGTPSKQFFRSIDNTLHCRAKDLSIKVCPESRTNEQQIVTRQQTAQASGRESKRSVKLCCSGRDENTRNRIALRANRGNEPPPSAGRMKRARESDVDSSGMLPRKQPRRSSPMFSKLKNAGTSIHGSETLSWQGRESTPVNGKNGKRLRDEEFSSHNMDLLSPIRSPAAEIHETSPRVCLSSCSGKQSCDKSFCFKCC